MVRNLSSRNEHVSFEGIKNRESQGCPLLLNTDHLDFDGHADDHGLLQELLVKFWRMVVHVQDGDEDFGQAVLALRVLGLDVEVVLGANLSVQGGPGLC